MIFVTLGTQKFSFSRIVDYLNKYIEENNIHEEVVIQSGFTKVESPYFIIRDFMSKEEYEENLAKCRVLITHAGVGSIINGLKNGKRVIALPRIKKYNEHIDDHQLQIAKKFSQNGYILTCYSYDEFANCINNIDSFVSLFDSSEKKLSLQIELLEFISQNFKE